MRMSNGIAALIVVSILLIAAAFVWRPLSDGWRTYRERSAERYSRGVREVQWRSQNSERDAADAAAVYWIMRNSLAPRWTTPSSSMRR